MSVVNVDNLKQFNSVETYSWRPDYFNMYSSLEKRNPQTAHDTISPPPPRTKQKASTRHFEYIKAKFI